VQPQHSRVASGRWYDRRIRRSTQLAGDNLSVISHLQLGFIDSNIVGRRQFVPQNVPHARLAVSQMSWPEHRDPPMRCWQQTS
jgi:hypothetical protein